MIKRIFILIFCSTLFMPGFALDYPPPDISQLLMHADAVVIVQVPAQLSTPYRVKINEVIIGELPPNELEVFENRQWQGGGRFFTQQALLFIKFNSELKRWLVLGPSAEGRLHVDDKWIYASGIMIGDSRAARHRINGRELQALRLNKTDFISALQDVDRCFAFIGKEKKIRIVHKCSGAELHVLRKKSDLHERLFSQYQH